MQIKKFFAAANTYGGFKSYFDKVFNPLEFDKLFIIKGGPGTGKSSLMRKIKEHFNDYCTKIEEICCSSDPESLDGLILEHNDKRIGFLDGTSPHEADTKYPGIIDSVINIGANWEERWLKASREKLIPLINEKRKAYETAYAHLKTAGFQAKEKERIDSAYVNTKMLLSAANSLAETISCKIGAEKTRLISSFGKDGIHTVSTSVSSDFSEISPIGSSSVIKPFMIALQDKLRVLGVDFYTIRNPLDNELIDKFLLPRNLSDTANNSSNEIDIRDYSAKISDVDRERSDAFARLHSDALAEAKRWFAIASDLHFRIEEIYSAAMDFSKNESICKRLISEITELFEAKAN